MKKNVFFAIPAIVLVMGLVPGAWAQIPSGDAEVVRKAMEAYLTSGKRPVIKADKLFEILNDGDAENDPFILSVRKPEHYVKGHIAGAVNIFWKNLWRPENLAKLPKDRQIVTYCYTGHTGQLAATILNALGYDAVNLKFGMMGWSKNDDVLAQPRFNPTNQPDYPVSNGPVKASRAFERPAGHRDPSAG
jgi:rhodanese-related sulfurtransferase